MANLIDNALIHAGGQRLRVEAGPVAGRVDIRIIDRGPGIRPRGPRPGVPAVPAPRGLRQPESVWAWGWPWPGDSWRRSAGASTSRTRPEGGCTMVVRIPESAPKGPDSPGPPRGSGSRGEHPGRGILGWVTARREPGGLGPTPTPWWATARRGPRCLVCDDDTALLRALSISLSARGYEVIVARNGEEGLDRAAQRRPDVVLVDLGLPGIDGVEVIRGIRGWSSVPIIVLSARHQSAEQGGGARRRGRRLRDQALRDGRAAGPPPGRAPTGRPGRRRHPWSRPRASPSTWSTSG